MLCANLSVHGRGACRYRQCRDIIFRKCASIVFVYLMCFLTEPNICALSFLMPVISSEDNVKASSLFLYPNLGQHLDNRIVRTEYRKRLSQ